MAKRGNCQEAPSGARFCFDWQAQSLGAVVAFFKDDHGAWKGCGRISSLKADTPAQVMDFRRKGQDIAVPPCRIRPGGKQADHSFSAFHLNFVHGLGQPMRQCPSVG